MVLSKEDRYTVKKIIGLLKPYIKKIIFIMFCIIASSGLSMLLPITSQFLVDKGLLAGNFRNVIIYSTAGLLIMMLDQGFSLIVTKYRSYIDSTLSYNLEKNAFKNTLKLKMQFFSSTNYSEIMSNLKMDIGNIARIANPSTFYILTSIFRILGGIVGLVIIDWRLTIMVILLVPGRYALVKYLAKMRKQLFEKYMLYNQEYSAWYGDTLGGIKEIKLLGLDRVKLGQFVKKQKNIIKINIKMAFLDKLNELSEVLLSEIISVLLYLIGAYMVMNKTFTVGGLFAFISYSSYVISPISAILNIGYSFTNILPSAKRYFNFMEMESEVFRYKNVLNHIDEKNINGNISFENISFSYNEGVPVLKDISFEVKAGEKVAIIGANGSGKTSIINLLLRLYNPDTGRILLDGMDIRSISLRDYRKLISVVSQEVYLFNTSIKENIMPFTSNNNDKVFWAAYKGQAQNFIEKLPQKYESIVGQRGSKLSGGERQKIAIARALARDSKILVLDEATSNCDMESEAQINELISGSFKDKTVIVVSHKLDILKNLDKVIVVRGGLIEDIGHHTELSKRNAFYMEYVESIKDAV